MYKTQDLLQDSIKITCLELRITSLYCYNHKQYILFNAGLMSYICIHQTKAIKIKMADIYWILTIIKHYLRALHTFILINPKTTPGDRYNYYLHFTNDKTEAQKLEELAHHLQRINLKNEPRKCLKLL